MKRNSSLLIICLLSVTAFTSAQNYTWAMQIVTDHYEHLQSIAVSDDGSASIVGFGNSFVKSTDGGESWQNTGIFETDHFDYQDISFFGNLGFAAAMTGYKVVDRPKDGGPDLFANSPLLKTTDGGDTWALITIENMGSGNDSSLNVSALGNYHVKFTAVKVIDANTIFVGVYWRDVKGNSHQNVYVSTDIGDTWKPLIPDNENNTISSIIEYNGNIYISGKETLYKVALSDHEVTNLYPIVDKGQDDDMFFTNTTRIGNELIFPSYADSIRITNDEGATFSTVPNIKKGHYVYKHDANTIVVIGGKNDTKATHDGGATWTSISTGESLWNGAIVGDSLVALAKNEIYTMAISDIASGKFAWTAKIITEISANLKGITSKGDTTYITGYNDLFLKSTDGAQTFTPVPLPSKSDIIYASAKVNLISISQGKGKAAVASTRRNKIVDYPSNGHNDVYTAGFLFSTTDNWNTFNVIDDTQIGAKYKTFSTNPYAAGCYGQEFFTVDCIDDSTFLTSVQWYYTDSADTRTTYGRIFKTSDAGQTWDSISPQLDNLFIKIVKADKNFVYIGGNKMLLKSDDFGASYTDLIPQLTALGASDPYIQDIKKNGDTLYIATTGDFIFVSYNNGVSFSKIDGVTGATSFVPIDANSWMTLGSESKSQYTNYGGDSIWTKCSPGFSVYNSGVYNNEIIALCKGGIFKLPIADLNPNIVASINENNVANANRISIQQSNQTLHLSSEKQITRCALYTITGQIAKSITPNTSKVSLETGTLTKGVYIVYVKTNGSSISQKIILK